MRYNVAELNASDDRAGRVRQRLSKLGACGLMQAGSLVSAKYGPVEVYITVDGGLLRMEAVPRSISDKELSAFLWRCHAAKMSIGVSSAGRLSGVIRGSDQEIVQAIAQFDSATKTNYNG